VFFDHDVGKTHSSGKLLFSARIILIVARGSISSSIRRNCVFARIDRRRKLRWTTFCAALGMNEAEILAHVLRHEHLFISRDEVALQAGSPAVRVARPRRSRSESASKLS